MVTSRRQRTVDTRFIYDEPVPNCQAGSSSRRPKTVNSVLSLESAVFMTPLLLLPAVMAELIFCGKP